MHSELCFFTRAYVTMHITLMRIRESNKQIWFSTDQILIRAYLMWLHMYLEVREKPEERQKDCWRQRHVHLFQGSKTILIATCTFQAHTRTSPSPTRTRRVTTMATPLPMPMDANWVQRRPTVC